MDNPTPTGGGLRAPLRSNLCRTCTQRLPALYARARSRRGPGTARRDAGGIRIDGGAAARRGDALHGSAHGEKGLKSDAISYVSNIVIGVASTAPAYSLAATLGFIVAVPGVGPLGAGGAARLVPPDAAASPSPTAT